MATLRDLLTAPFLFRGESVPAESGGWTRVASYPELGCQVSGENMMEVVEELEVQRVRMLVAAVEHGDPIPSLRPSLADDGLEPLLRRAGLASWIAKLDEDPPSAAVLAQVTASERQEND